MVDKFEYNNIEIPDNLETVVRDAIEEGLYNQKPSGRMAVLKRVACAAAVCMFCLTALVNVSPAFAAAAYDIPVVGDLCRIITFREYHFEDEIKYVDVEIPEISNTGKTELEQRVNLEIQNVINALVEENNKRAKDYYDAFVATGGKPEDYIPVGITIGYEIKCNNQDYVSFTIFQHETKYSAYNYVYYYNIDMETGREITLRDWLGNDYKEIASDSIEKSIAGWSDGEKALLWKDLNVEDFITEDRQFYINEQNQAVVVFEKYEIAAGAAGTLEFVIDIKAE